MHVGPFLCNQLRDHSDTSCLWHGCIYCDRFIPKFMMEAVNPVLQKERNKATFPVEELTNIIDGSKQRTERRRYIESLALKDKELEGPDMNFLSQDEMFTEGMRKAVHLVRKLKELDLEDFDDVHYYQRLVFPNESHPLALQTGMFLPYLESQSTPEQAAKFLQRARNREIIGTYAQTEMGHGTFIRGLETTATYDPSTETFVMNSPTITSMKWWPGNLGKSVNYAVVMATLVSKGQKHGLHGFLVQLRSLDDHRTLPGVTLGDIGPKFGYNANDNGFLKFDNVRIPRENMLMRNAKVLPDGTFVKGKSDKLTYGTMVYTRALIVNDGAEALAQVCTIVTRYSVIRHQTEVTPGYEPPVLDYQTQQAKIFPWIATSYAFTFVAQSMYQTYLNINAEIEAGNLDLMPELHSLSAGLKAFTSSASNTGIELMRLACGGHGYSHASGIPKIYTHNTPRCTFEGENTVMLLQTARYLIKSYNRNKANQKLSGSVAYLSERTSSRSSIGADVSISSLVDAYKHRALSSVAHCGTKLGKLSAQGKREHEAWNMTSYELTQAAMAHCHFFTVKKFYETLEKASVSAPVRKVLHQLCQLYGVIGIIENAGDFLKDGYLTGGQLDMVNDRMLSLLAELRPNAVALVDAFDIPDRLLGSVLGRYDGYVYENLYKYAQNSSLNKSDVHPAYQKHLRGLIKGLPAKL